MAKKFNSISEILGRSKQFTYWKKAVEDNEVLELFSSLFPELDKVALPVRFSNAILYVKVENAGWRSELKFQEQAILEKINRRFGEERVKKITFVI